MAARPDPREAEKKLAAFFASSLDMTLPANRVSSWHIAAVETELRKGCELFKDWLVSRVADVQASTAQRLGDPEELASYFDDFVAEHVTGPLREFDEAEEMEAA